MAVFPAKFWALIVLVSLQGLTLGPLLPLIPSLGTNYFAIKKYHGYTYHEAINASNLSLQTNIFSFFTPEGKAKTIDCSEKNVDKDPELRNNCKHLSDFTPQGKPKNIDCNERHVVDKDPELKQICKDAVIEAGFAQQISDSVSFLVTFLIAPFFGSKSDQIGRVPILIVLNVLNIIPSSVLLINNVSNNSLDFIWYYVASSLCAQRMYLSVACAYIADIIEAEKRGWAIGVLFGSYSCVTYMISPLIVNWLSDLEVFVCVFSFGVLCVLYSIFVLPESRQLNLDARKGLRARNNSRRDSRDDQLEISLIEHIDDTIEETVTGENSAVDFCCPKRFIYICFHRILEPLTILNRSSFLRMLSIIVLLEAAATQGFLSLILYYDKAVFHFNESDMSLLLFVVGFAGIIVQGCLIRPLGIYLGEKGLLLLATLAAALNSLSNALAPVLASFSQLVFPVVNSICSSYNKIDKDEQGKMQGAVFAIRSIGEALGPTLFGLIWRESSKVTPRLVMYCIFGIMSIAALIVVKLPVEDFETVTRNEGNILNSDNVRSRRNDSDVSVQEVSSEEVLLTQ